MSEPQCDPTTLELARVQRQRDEAVAEVARLQTIEKRLRLALSYAENDDGHLHAPPMQIANVGDGHCIACGKPIADLSFVRRYSDGSVHEECP